MFVHRFIDASYANESSANNFTERAVNPCIERFRKEYFMERRKKEGKEFMKRPFIVTEMYCFDFSQKLCKKNGLTKYTLHKQDLFYSRSLERFFKECILGVKK
jgi:hypothetical protein